MERGAFHGYLPTLSSSSSEMMNHPNMNNNNNKNKTTRNGGEEEECKVREQDRFMPIANVIRIMRRMVPAHAKISDDAKETMQECVSEFIGFVTGEANDRCQREQRKTITAEDILYAMSKLGFDSYVDPLSLFLQRYRDLESGAALLESRAIRPAAANHDYHHHHHHHQVVAYHPQHPAVAAAGYYGQALPPPLPPGFDSSYGHQHNEG